MSQLKKSGMALVLSSGIVETVVAFVAYWIFYVMYKTGADGMTIYTPMVLLLSGMLGGILAIIGAVLIKTTKLGGPILSLVAAGLELFATLFLMIRVTAVGSSNDAAMIILPFFILPNALAIAGGVMAIVPPKDESKKVESAEEAPKE